MINGFPTQKPLEYQLYLDIFMSDKKETGSFSCGATLITYKLAITAHHCFEDKKLKLKKVTAYGNLYNKRQIKDKNVQVSRKDLHETDLSPLYFTFRKDKCRKSLSRILQKLYFTNQSVKSSQACEKNQAHI